MEEEEDPDWRAKSPLSPVRRTALTCPSFPHLTSSINTKPTNLSPLLLSTGGGSGFGAAIATRFAQEGANVIAGDVNVEGAQAIAAAATATAAEAGAQNLAGSLTAMKMDVTSIEDWNAVVAHAMSAHGRVDVLVNNAGAAYKNKVRTYRSTPMHMLIYHCSCAWKWKN